jgi:monoamine oxidase
MPLQNKMDTESYDVIIIGSGIAGMYAALHLQKKGRRCIVVEQWKELGGRTSTFKQKINGVDLQWEAGAGRISEHHTHVRALMRKYKLTWIPIGGAPKFVKDFGEPLEDHRFDEGFPIFFRSIAALPPEELATHTIRQLLMKLHGPAATDEYLLRYPYRGEVDTMRADAALKLFENEMNDTERYGICSEGFGAIIEGMRGDVERHGGKFLMNHMCVEVKQERKGPVTVLLSHESEPVTLTARHCILAVPSSALKKIRPFDRWKPLRHVAMKPLLRFYGVFPVEGGKLWTEPFGRIVTPKAIRYMIPGNPAVGSVQISYTDSQDAEFWKEKIDATGESKVSEEILEQLRRLLTPTIPGPTFVKSHYWKDGVSYWLPGSYTMKEISREAYHPLPDLPGVHVCGESFCMRQGWVEGAIEHSAGLVSILEKKLSHR